MSRFKVFGIAAFSAALILLLCLFSNAGNLLLLKENPEKADAIVILMGGVRPERAEQAAKLFHDNFAPWIVFGSGFNKLVLDPELMPDYQWSASGERYLRNLLKLDIPRNRVIQIPSDAAYDTESEMQLIIAYAKSRSWKKVNLVTSASHSRRAKIIWSRLSSDIQAQMVPSDDPRLAKWWQTKNGRRTISHEFLGYGKEILRQIGILS